MKSIISAIMIVSLAFLPVYANAVVIAERISDREIIESLASLKEGQVSLNKRIDDTNRRIDDLKEDVNNRLDDTNRRIDDTNRRIDDLRLEMRSLFSVMQWMLGIFITLALVILGFVLRLQWKMQNKQVDIETSLAAQREETAFLKALIEKLIPPQQTASGVSHP